MAREQLTDEIEQQDPDYTEFRVTKDGRPAGLTINAVDRAGAERLLQVAATRLGFSTTGVGLEADE